MASRRSSETQRRLGLDLRIENVRIGDSRQGIGEFRKLEISRKLESEENWRAEKIGEMAKLEDLREWESSENLS